MALPPQKKLVFLWPVFHSEDCGQYGMCGVADNLGMSGAVTALTKMEKCAGYQTA
jgi:hypothetical protein